MTRPRRNVVDYFPHDAHAAEGRTMTILFNRFGHEGYSCWFQLLEIISATENHVIAAETPEDREFLAAKLRLPPERLHEILAKLADLGAIDKQLFESGQIWSDHFIEGIADVYSHRGRSLPMKPALRVPETPIPASETPIPDIHNPQRKVKESKGKETPFIPHATGSSLISLFSEAEINDLKTRFPDADLAWEATKCSSWWSEGKKTLKRPRAAFQNWLERANGNGRRSDAWTPDDRPKWMRDRVAMPEALDALDRKLHPERYAADTSVADNSH